MTIVTQNISLILIAIALLGSCSRKKDKFLNREFHSLTTQYNYLFNGNNLLNQGKDEVDQSVFDNYWELLPIEKTIVKIKLLKTSPYISDLLSGPKKLITL